MDNFHTELYPNVMENAAENRTKFHLQCYVIMTPTSQIVMKIIIYQQNYVQVHHMGFHPK